MDPAERPLQQPIEERELSGEWPSQRTGKRPKLDKFFRAMVKYGASDLHIRPGTPPYLRVDTMIKPTTSDPPTAEEIEAMASELMTAKQAAFFTEHGSIDVAYEVPGGDRFRVNVYRQRGRVSMAVRRVTRDIPDFATLHLPAVLEITRSLLELIEQGFIDPKVAYDHAPNVDELKMVMKGITTSRTGLVGR